MIAIIDYGAGNIGSVKNALDRIGVSSVITSNPKDIKTAERIILPGVGAFGAAMDSLRSKGLEEPLKAALKRGVPFLGICLGLQILFEQSEESIGVKGMEIFKGRAIRFTEGKVPQIGWNRIIPKAKGEIFRQGYAYFVNSYYVKPEDKSIIAAITDYYGEFACAVQCKNITAVQFHPEKSGEYGMGFLRRWMEC
ncbi:MAG: imidazole glycerol phosphate synthase subunit HisH [Nanoarchaeota archaeon]|nr:imidazole glycerol phosphate synthase subunit HisH [Nanoarchaeota archaeon]